MSVVKRIRRKNRLREIVSAPGGLTVGQALRAAEANVQALHADGVRFIDERLEEIHRIAAALPDQPDDATLDELYRLSDQVHGLAGTFGLDQLGRAAHSLCDLIDRQRSAAKPNAAAVAVHLDGLSVLRSETGDPAERERMLDGLRQVVERA